MPNFTDFIIYWIYFAFLLLITLFFISGCSAYGVDLSDDRTIVIEKSPYRIIASGDLTASDQDFINGTIRQLANEKYIDHNFTAVKVGVIGSETEIKNIDLHYDSKTK